MRNRVQSDVQDAILATIQKAMPTANHDQVMAFVNTIKAVPVAERVRGAEIACALLSSWHGLAIFFEDQEWRDTLTISEVNDTDQFGRNVLQMICKHDEGRQFINADENFRSKITEEGFCAGGRQSAAYYFLSSADGVDIMLAHQALRMKLTPAFLNSGDNTDSMPILYELAKTKKGVLLLADPYVRGKISDHGLNVQSTCHSTVSFLVREAEGVALFSDDVFRAKVMPSALNAVNESEDDSPVLHLCRAERGREVLAVHQGFCKRINAEAFNHLSADNTSPVFYLAKSAIGRQALEQSKYLSDLISSECLNAVCSGGEDKGASVAFWLISTEGGREVLMKNKKLRLAIQPEVLQSQIVEGEFAGRSALDYLAADENRDLLRVMSSACRESVSSIGKSNLGLFAQRNEEMVEVQTTRSHKRCVIL
tara:strand:+ start:858 stop:2132 length:1275 start_codon:yes stop_codon:yes gene_type:complete